MAQTIPKKAAAKKAVVAPKKDAAKKATTTPKPAARKAATKPVGNVKEPFLEITSNTTGEAVRIPLSGDLLDAVIGAISRDTAARIETPLSGHNNFNTRNGVDAYATKETISANSAIVYGGKQPVPAAPRGSSFSNRIIELQDTLSNQGVIINRLNTQAGFLYGDTPPLVDLPVLSNGDTNLFSQLDELLKYLRVYNSNIADLADRLANSI